MCPKASFQLKTFISAHFRARHIHRVWFESHSKRRCLMLAVEAEKETGFANEHSGRVCLVVLLSVISKYSNQETGAGS